MSSIFSPFHTVLAIKAWSTTTNMQTYLFIYFYKYFVYSFNKLFHLKCDFPANISYILKKKNYDIFVWNLSSTCNNLLRPLKWHHLQLPTTIEIKRNAEKKKKSVHITRHFIFHIFPTWLSYWMSCFTHNIPCTISLTLSIRKINSSLI